METFSKHIFIFSYFLLNTLMENYFSTLALTPKLRLSDPVKNKFDEKRKIILTFEYFVQFYLCGFN